MMKKSRPANHVGNMAEEIAVNHVHELGAKIITQNFHSRFGEIDLIALDQDVLVFIEVRYRKKEQYLSALETVDRHKCRKIITTSEYYLSKHKAYRFHQCRFDVITITGDLQKPVIKWIKNAFQA